MNLPFRVPLILLALLVSFQGSCGAAEIPYLAGRVTDLAGILSDGNRSEIEAMLAKHEKETSNQIVVLTIASLEGDVLEEFSYKVASTWKLGTKEKDNGVLLLIVKNDRKLRIEVGDGLEGALPDVTCGRIIRNQIVPLFKKGKYEEGIRAGIDAILQAVAGEYATDDSSERHATGDSMGLVFASLLFFFVVGLFTMIGVFTPGWQSWFLFLFLIPFWFLFPTAFYGGTIGSIVFGLYIIVYLVSKKWLKRSARGKAIMSTWGKNIISSGGGRGSSSGGSFSGGGGSFSGGGASGSW